MNTPDSSCRHLKGRIEHRLNFSSKEKGRKSASSSSSRRKCSNDNNNQSRTEDTTTGKATATGTLSYQCHNDVGFFFLCNDFIDKSSGEEQRKHVVKEFRIIVPHLMLKAVCDAIRFNLLVTITEYALIDINIDDDDDDNDNNGNSITSGIDHCSHNDRVTTLKLIEVHNNGLVLHECSPKELENKICHPTTKTSKTTTKKTATTTTNEVITMTLSQFQDFEILFETSLNKKQKGGKLKSKKDENYNIIGQVDAISSIVASVPTDPFALLELYDTETPSVSAIVVLKGIDVLCCQPAIQPGDKLKFLNVKRQRWHLPTSFRQQHIPERLHCRAPTHVFVVTDCKSIMWESWKDSKIDDKSRAWNCILPLPTTIDSLSSIQGMVVSVQYSHPKVKQKSPVHTVSIQSILHHIVIETASTRCKLHMSYYPMSPDLYFGIQVGSYIRAVNIHCIPINTVSRGDESDNKMIMSCYGACFRSTITVLAYVTDSLSYQMAHYGMIDSHNKDNNNDSFDNHYTCTYGRNKRNNVIHSDFYVFHNINGSYMEREWMTSIRTHAASYCKSSSEIYETLRIGISNCNLSVRSERKYSRDPYQEWFDHACESHHEDDIMLCPAGKSQPLPIVVNISEVRKYCMEDMRNLLKSDSRFARNSIASTRTFIGWTASKVYNRNQLHELMNTSHPNFHFNLPFYVCGAVDEISADGKCVSQVSDGKCQLPFTLISNEGLSRMKTESGTSLYERGDFVLVDITRVIVSCLYLGSDISIHSADQNNEEIDKIFHLKPQGVSDDRIVWGACDLYNIRDHRFIISIQLQYHPNCVISSAAVTRTKRYNETSISTRNDDSLESVPKNRVSLTRCILSQNQCTINKDGNELFYEGRLLHLSWKLKKSYNNQYNGCIMALSYIPLKEGSSLIPVSNQSIDVKLTIPIKSCNQESMKQAFTSVFVSTNRDIMSMSCAWRVLSENHTHCPVVLSWGHIYLDIEKQTANQNIACGINVLIPVTELNIAHQNASQLKADMIRAHVKEFPSDSKSFNYFQSSFNGFTFVDEGKKLPGILNQCVRRALIYNGKKRKFGELIMSPKSFNGIPTLTLATLLYRLVHDMALKQTPPNLVWRIGNARLSTLKFCRVKIECTRCFKFLVEDETIQVQNEKDAKKRGIASVSFWDQPFPMHIKSDHKSSQNCNIFNRRKLFCPSGCKNEYASPKWEVSGVIDDGTGSARLYAERDAALILLGSGLNFSMIEEGAWESKLGVEFQKGVPLSSVVQSDINRIQNIAVKSKTAWEKGKSLGIHKHHNKLSTMLPMKVRAEYELNRHCVGLNHRSRHMDFICRCKNVPVEKQTLKPLDISIVSALGCHEKVAISSSGSYILPNLELKLVDCIRSLRESDEVAWSIAKTL